MESRTCQSEAHFCSGHLERSNVPLVASVPNCRKIAIALTDPDFGEQKTQSCAMAWLRQLRT